MNNSTMSAIQGAIMLATIAISTPIHAAEPSQNERFFKSVTQIISAKMVIYELIKDEECRHLKVEDINENEWYEAISKREQNARSITQAEARKSIPEALNAMISTKQPGSKMTLSQQQYQSMKEMLLKNQKALGDQGDICRAMNDVALGLHQKSLDSIKLMK